MDADQKPLAAIRGVVFDKDGTLFDFNATWSVWTARLLDDLAGGDAEQAARLGRVVGYDIATSVFAPDSPVIAHTTAEIAQILLPHLPGADPDALLARMNRLAAAVDPVPACDLRAVLGDLRAIGCRIGLATNDAEAPARAHLAATGIADLFDFVAGFDSGYGGKPEAGQMQAFLRQTGLAPEAVVMVGDSAHDMIAGRAAGMATVAVLTGVAGAEALAPHADVVLRDITLLPGWITRRDHAAKPSAKNDLQSS